MTSSIDMHSTDLPDALLLIASGCIHCPVVTAAMLDLVKDNRVGRLEIVNVAAHPEVAREAGTRSVPWLRLGPFELEGAQSPADLARWAEHARAGDGHAPYLQQLLESRKLADCVARARRGGPWLAALAELAGDLDTPMGVRIGVGAVLEDLEPGELHPLLGDLAQLARADAVQVRADAAHYLGLLGPPAREQLERLARDPDPEVREIAAESLAMLA